MRSVTPFSIISVAFNTLKVLEKNELLERIHDNTHTHTHTHTEAHILLAPALVYLKTALSDPVFIYNCDLVRRGLLA